MLCLTLGNKRSQQVHVPSTPTTLLIALFSGSVSRYLKDGETFLAEFFDTRIEGLGQELSHKIDGITALTSKIDGIAAVTSKCLLVSGRQETPCPRLIMVTPESSLESAPSGFSHFRRETMGKLFPNMGTPKPQCYRVHFLCPYDLSAATCGDDGRGYKVNVKDWQIWLHKCLPLVQVSIFSS